MFFCLYFSHCFAMNSTFCLIVLQILVTRDISVNDSESNATYSTKTLIGEDAVSINLLL